MTDAPTKLVAMLGELAIRLRPVVGSKAEKNTPLVVWARATVPPLLVSKVAVEALPPAIERTPMMTEEAVLVRLTPVKAMTLVALMLLAVSAFWSCAEPD